MIFKKNIWIQFSDNHVTKKWNRQFLKFVFENSVFVDKVNKEKCILCFKLCFFKPGLGKILPIELQLHIVMISGMWWSLL